MLVAGVDSSTQSCKVVLCRAKDGTVVGRGSAPHPPGTEADPAAWWTALLEAGDGLLERADAVGVAGQQHGMVVLDSGGEVIRPALLWNDLRSAPAAAELVAELGGPQWWASHVGSVPFAGIEGSDCAPHWGPPAFLDWPGCGPLWANLVAWLARRR